jgi:hypothetical protein
VLKRFEAHLNVKLNHALLIAYNFRFDARDRREPASASEIHVPHIYLGMSPSPHYTFTFVDHLSSVGIGQQL